MPVTKRGNHPRSSRYSTGRRFTIRRSRRKRYKGRINRSLLPKKYMFKRSIVETIVLNPGGVTPPTGWQVVDNGLCTFDIHNLGQLNDYTDFTNLFAQYKINGVSTKMYMSCTGAESGSALGNAQIQLLRAPYQTGAGLVSGYTEQKFLDMQTRKINTLIKANGRPVNFYQRTNQLSEIYESAVSSSYGVIRPKWVSTSETQTPHYSNILRLQLVNGQDLLGYTAGSVVLSLKIIRTFYISMRKVD